MKLSKSIAKFLIPFLPYLLRLGNSDAEEAGKEFGDRLAKGSWEKALQIWEKVEFEVKQQTFLIGAFPDSAPLARFLANNPEHRLAQAAFVKKFDALLEADQDLARALQELFEEDPKAKLKDRMATDRQLEAPAERLRLKSPDGNLLRLENINIHGGNFAEILEDLEARFPPSAPIDTHCYIYAEMDSRVILQRVTTLEVVVSGDKIEFEAGPTSQGGEVSVSSEKSLIVQTIAKTNFTVIGEDRIELDPPESGQSHRLYFDLRPTDLAD